jgi:hypothetical protein
MMQGLQDTHNVFQCDGPGGAMNTIRLKSVNCPRTKLVTQHVPHLLKITTEDKLALSSISDIHLS